MYLVIGRVVPTKGDRAHHAREDVEQLNGNRDWGVEGSIDTSLRVEFNAGYLVQRKHRPRPAGTEVEISRFERGGFDLVPDLFEKRGETLGGEDAGSHNLILANSNASRGVDGLEQGLLVLTAHRLAEATKRLTSLYRPSLRVPQSVGHNHPIACVLVEELVRLDVQRVCCRIPDHLIDANNAAAIVTIVVARVIAIAKHTAEADQKDRLASCRRYVDRTVERYRESWISAKAV